MASKFIGDIQANNHIISKGGSAGTGYGGTINSASIDFQDPNNSQNVEIVHDPFDTSLTEAGYGLRIRTSSTNTQGGLGAQLHVEGNIYAQGYNRVFHDTYHPNADKLTTARTISLGGNASGSASFDGSADVSISVSNVTANKIVPVANDTFTGTYPLVWTASNIPYTSSFMTINGSTDTLNVPNISLTGNVNVASQKGLVTTGAWIRNTTAYGYIDIGPANASYAHIYTANPAFYFNKGIFSTGDITAYASDKRLKENIETIDNALDKVMSLSGMTYTWNKTANELAGYDMSTKQVGVFAQDVQAVLPEAVAPAPFDIADGHSVSGEDYLTVKYEKLVPLLIESIKELKAENEALKARLDKLEGK